MVTGEYSCIKFQMWAVVHKEISNSLSLLSKKEGRNAKFSQCLLLSHHLLIFIVLSHSSYLQPSSHHSSICPRSLVTAKSGFDRGGCIVGRLLGGWRICLPAGVMFHWRRESIMPPWRRKHRSFPVGKSGCSPNPKHSFAFLSSADNLKCLFGTGSQASDCMSLRFKRITSGCNL